MKLILIGALGRMGREVTACSEECGVTIVCGIDTATGEAPFPLYASLKGVKEEADAVLDFSSPAGLDEKIEYAKARSLPLILGATGYSEEDLEKISEAARTLPVFRTGNFSLGINLLELLSKKAAAVLEGFDAEIVERHHNQKKDAPSGTALMLAESVREGANGQKTFVYGRHGQTGARDRQEIGIHAVRGGTIVGEHEVMFLGPDENVTLSHSARSRRVFATGALRAALFMQGKKAGLYNMHDLLEELI